MDSRIENGIKLAAPVGTLFILFGLLVANFYYSAFGIDIFPYIEFGEAIMLFLSVILPLLTIFTIMGFLFYFYLNEEPGGLESPGKLVRLWLLTMVIPTCFILFDLFISKRLRRYTFLDLTWYSYWLPFIKIVYIFVNARILLMKQYQFLVVFHAIGIFIVGLIFTAELKVLSTANNKGSQVTLSFRDNTQLQSDSSLLFLGKTKNYFIFFNIRTKQSVLQPADLVGKIVVKSQ